MSQRKRVLVTGAAGFVGRHLTDALSAEGREVLGVGHEASGAVRDVDVRDRCALEDCLTEFRPDAVVHLAALTYLPAVYAEPEMSFDVNVLGTLTLLQAVRKATPWARVLPVSTCVVYGDPGQEDLPLVESAPLRSVHPYGVHKIGLELLARRFASEGLDIVVPRPFNHIGPGMDPRISVMHFARQIAEAEAAGGAGVLRVGNLEARRDFLDVRDVVDAYVRLIDHADPPRTVNVCSGESVSLAEILDSLVARASIPVTVERDPARYRPLDVPELRGAPGLLQRTTGWERRFTLDETLDAILESARAGVAR